MGYLAATVAVLNVANPMVRMDLSSYIPPLGALGTDPVWGAPGSVAESILWMRRRQIIGGRVGHTV